MGILAFFNNPKIIIHKKSVAPSALPLDKSYIIELYLEKF